MTKKLLSLFLTLTLTFLITVNSLAATNSSYMDSLLGNLGADKPPIINIFNNTLPQDNSADNSSPKAITFSINVQRVKIIKHEKVKKIKEIIAVYEGKTFESHHVDESLVKIKEKYGFTDYMLVAYACDLYYQSPAGLDRVVKKVKQNFGSVSKFEDLGSAKALKKLNKYARDDIYKDSSGNFMGLGVYSSRRDGVYEYITNNLSEDETVNYNELYSSSVDAIKFVWNTNDYGFKMHSYKIEVKGFNRKSEKLKYKKEITINVEKSLSKYSEYCLEETLNRNLNYTVTITPYYYNAENKICKGKSNASSFITTIQPTITSKKISTVIKWKKSKKATSYDVYASNDTILSSNDKKIINHTTKRKAKCANKECENKFIFLVPNM